MLAVVNTPVLWLIIMKLRGSGVDSEESSKEAKEFVKAPVDARVHCKISCRETE